MKEKVSALVDGELEVIEVSSALSALQTNGDLRAAWDEYELIGAALRRDALLSSTIQARVMAELAHEATVLAPRKPIGTTWIQPVLAMAASLAGVAIVLGVVYSYQIVLPEADQKLARKQDPALSRVAKRVETPVSMAEDREMKAYLAAHQANVQSLQGFGGVQHIRVISAAARDERK